MALWSGEARRRTQADTSKVVAVSDNVGDALGLKSDG